MATGTLAAGTRTNLTTTALNSLASATYVNAGTIDVSAVDPVDLIIEVAATPGTVASNKQLVVFLQVSMNNSNFSTGPTSGNSVTDEANLKFLGVLPLNSNATQQLGAFSVAEALGFVPPYMKVICKNETGAALAASGHSVDYTTYVANVV